MTRYAATIAASGALRCVRRLLQSPPVEGALFWHQGLDELHRLKQGQG